MKKILTTICLVLLVLLLASTVNAITPLGPPLPSYEAGDKALGVEYAVGETAFEFSALGIGASSDIETNLLFATYNTGITDNLELVVRVGGSELEPQPRHGISLSSDYGVAAGFGVKYGLPSIGNTDWAFIAQSTWMTSSSTGEVWASNVGPDGYSLDFQVSEIQIAFGTERVLNDHITLYGGPMVQLISGSGDIPITEDFSIDVDIKSRTDFGGFIGTEWKLDNSRSLFAELQLVGEGLSICGGALWRF